MPKTVLIVEDNELNMKLFHDLLEAHGYQTVGTRNGIEALDLARKHRPDLILMDIQLPEVSGLEVTKWLKDDPELKAIPVVAVTAFRHEGRRRAHPRRRVRGLSVKADLGREIHRDHSSFSGRRLTTAFIPPTATRVIHSLRRAGIRGIPASYRLGW